MNTRSCFAPLAALVFGYIAVAAPSIGRAQTASATFRPSLVESFATSYSYSGKSGYKHDATSGESSVWHIDASASGRSKIGESAFFHYGAAFALNTIDSSEGVPVPERLGELSFNVGATRLFSPEWRVSVFLRPGYYGDMEHYTARAINVPGIALASYTPNRSLTWLFGVSVNPFSEYIVMPVVSVNWKFAPDWSLNVGFPRIGVSWQVSKPVELAFGATFQGGGYRTTQAPNNSGRTDLANTYINYREIRTGLRASYRFSAKASLALEAGWMVDRRFDYFDRDYELKGKSSAYGTIALDVRL